MSARIICGAGAMPRARTRFVRRVGYLADYRPINWFRILADLKRSGWTHEQIAYQIDCNKTAVGNWAIGEFSPKFKNGEMLLLLWRQETGKDDVPRC